MNYSNEVKELFKFRTFGFCQGLDLDSHNVQIHEIDPTLYSLPVQKHTGLPSATNFNLERFEERSVLDSLSFSEQIYLRDYIVRTLKFYDSGRSKNKRSYIIPTITASQILMMRPEVDFCHAKALGRLNLNLLIDQRLLLQTIYYMIRASFSNWVYLNKSLNKDLIPAALAVTLVKNLDHEASDMCSLNQADLWTEVKDLAEQMSAMEKPEFAKLYFGGDKDMEIKHYIAHSNVPEKIDTNAINKMYLEVVRA